MTYGCAQTATRPTFNNVSDRSLLNDFLDDALDDLRLLNWNFNYASSLVVFRTESVLDASEAIEIPVSVVSQLRVVAIRKNVSHEFEADSHVLRNVEVNVEAELTHEAL